MRDIPREDRWFHPDRPGLVRPERACVSGGLGPTRDQARGPHWRQTSRGFYVPSWVERTTSQRVLEAATVLPERFGGVTGWAALAWAGGAWFDGTCAGGTAERAVVLATGCCDVSRQPGCGIAVSEERLGPIELIDIEGLRLTSLPRSLCFEMRYAPSLRAAVEAMDMAAYNDLVSIEEETSYALAHPGWTGIPQCREALALCDENSWSPAEVRMRMTWVLDAGFPRPLCNVPIFDLSGNLIGVPDIFDPEAGVVGEYDGEVHLEGAQRARDVHREGVFRRHGLEYFTVLAGDSANRSRLVQRMTETRRRAKWLPESRRDWTLRLPPWWTPTFTVEQRRALDDVQREKLLRLRLKAA